MKCGRESCPEEEIAAFVGGWKSPSCVPIPLRRQECCREERDDSEHPPPEPGPKDGLHGDGQLTVQHEVLVPG